MKKRILSAVLLSGATLGATVSVNAEDYDTKIAAKDNAITNLTSQQAAAQLEVESIQTQVGTLSAQQADLEAQNVVLKEKSATLSTEIQTLSEKIVARSESLKKQARSAQKQNTATNYINTVVNSKSISEAISKVVAIREVVSANHTMLEKQESDKAALAEKQKENQAAINTIAANQATLAANKSTLETQQAELKAAQATLAVELATVEGEKSSLVAEKSTAESVAASVSTSQSVAASVSASESTSIVEAAASASAVASEVAASVSASVTASESVAAVSASTAAVEAQQTSEVASAAPRNVVQPQAAAPAPAVSPASTHRPSSVMPTVNTAGNTYPVGQCTWGAKSLAPWAGNNWGNGGQWAVSAAAAGFSVGSTPTVGSIAVWNDGGYGHVAVVVAVESSTRIQVMEANYNGIQSIGNHRGWFNPTATYQGAAVYIYPR
ncbi:coiled-coil domain-containing protein [Streptococcus pluranimalium]|uniref:coiled-coil domain-containing protein n=1 Tax=Streptococcus pluranimalium TaxID=82348 RepID=UPI003F66264E